MGVPLLVHAAVFSNLMFRYWSTETRVPLMARSFLSSTVTFLPPGS